MPRPSLIPERPAPATPRARCTFPLVVSLASLASLASLVAIAPSRAHAQATPNATASSTGAAPKLTRPPTLVEFVEAPYPESEKSAGRAASVVLRLGIDARGHVAEVAVSESAGPAFDAAAMDAARKFIFEPAEIDGKPSGIRILYKYDFVLRVEALTTAPLDGIVRARKTKKPLAGVKVTVDGDETAVTDAEGAFHFEALPPGERTLTLEGESLTALQTTETVVAGEKLAVTYDVEPRDPTAAAEDQDDLEIVVTAPAVVKQVVSTAVSADEGRRVPGTQGDVLKVVENLPGVARAAVGSGQVVVWGAAPEDTRVYLNDVPVPRLYHQGGFRSIVHADLVKSVELVPGGWGADYGRGLGGLVTVQLKDPEKERLHGSVSADLLDASAAMRSRIAENVTVEVAGRKSYLDALLPLVTSRNVGEYVPIPRYHDLAARVVWESSAKESVEVGGLLSADAVDNSVPSSDPASLEQQSHETSFGRVWVRWKRHLDDGGEFTVVPAFGVDADTLVDRFGAAPSNLAVHSNLVSVRASYRKTLASWITVTGGVDGQLTRSHYARTGSNSTPPRTDDPFVFGQPPSGQLAHDEGTVVAASVAPNLTGDFAIADGMLHLVPGLRLEPYVISVDRRVPPVGDQPPTGLFTQRFEAEPRVSARFTPVPYLTWKAGWGLYHQAPAPADLSSVFGNPTAALASAQHVLGGFALGTPDSLSFELTAFYVRQKDLVVRSPLPSPLLAQALLTSGVGRVRGLQLLLRQQVSKRFFGWITYTLSKSERAEAEGDPYYPYLFDQTHVLGAVASYDLGAGFEVGARFRYATGYPRTPLAGATGAYYDVRTGRYEPLFGALNSTRIPPFVQLDARVAKRFTLAPSSVLEIYLDVQNVTNRENPEELVYSPDFAQRRTITGLPLLPVLGARLTW